jgi:hypothetical protein
MAGADSVAIRDETAALGCWLVFSLAFTILVVFCGTDDVAENMRVGLTTSLDGQPMFSVEYQRAAYVHC